MDASSLCTRLSKLLTVDEKELRSTALNNQHGDDGVETTESRCWWILRTEGGDDGVEMLVDSKDMQQQSKALDKLTDRVEDRQLDSTRVQEAMTSIAASAEADRNAMILREKELAAVKINAAEVDITASEVEVKLTFFAMFLMFNVDNSLSNPSSVW
ncbi:hypothetical protein SDJN03_13490, partial [Cucurbita argyrosperma subsp. sororia]